MRRGHGLGVGMFLPTWLALLSVAPPASGQEATPSNSEATQPRRIVESKAEASSTIPTLRPAPTVPLAGRTLTRLRFVTLGGRWDTPFTLKRVVIGEAVSGEMARRAMRELLDTGRFASVRAMLEADGSGAELVLEVLPRRLIASLRIRGSPLDADSLQQAAAVREGGEITSFGLNDLEQRLERLHQRRGFPNARAAVTATDTDDPLRIVLSVDVAPGEPLRVVERQFAVWPSTTVVGLRRALETYAIDDGDRYDVEVVDAAGLELEKLLRQRGWHRASVTHSAIPRPTGVLLQIIVRTGPLIRPRFEGNVRFDDTELLAALDLEESDDRAPATLVARLEQFYAKRGFLDATVSVSERGKADAPIQDLVFRIRERRPVRVVAREFACLSGPRDAGEVGSEIDGVLSQELPGGTILGSVDSRVVDQTFGPQQTTGARVVPYEPNPWLTYMPDVYEQALKHVRDLYRSEGYLSVLVGPASLLRRRCDPRTDPSICRPVGPRRRPRTSCAVDEVGVPLPEAEVDPAHTCTPDVSRGIRCESDAVLHIPIKVGPRAEFYDLSFEGNQRFTEERLKEIADLELGGPASQVELDKARRRLLDEYAEQGFAFADVETALELSPDKTRARARFVIGERQRVIVSGIVVRGATRTNESLIRSRVALEVGQPYRRSLVRTTEERLATLGVFAAVTVGFEDPYIPAKEKVVVITVQERKPQYLDVRPGFSTGEGFRITFEYGHRNLGGEAIQLTLRSQLGYLPGAFILEKDVRDKFDELDVGQRLERRNSATVEFPNVGLGPLFRLSVEGIDVRDNARDFGLTKDAGIVTLIFRPSRRFSATLGGSLELNTAEIFGQTEKGALEEYVKNNPRRRDTFRVPEGTTVAVAQRVGVTWDRRDNPLGATTGTLVSASVEHVRATPVGEEDAEVAPGQVSVFAATTSEFLRLTNRLAGYARLSDKGLAVAVSFRWGLNTQLIPDSRTYPDRLFFLGGVDSLRGFLQDSMVPEDIAQQLIDPNSGLTLQEVVIRGGDAFINPRAELRVPLSGDVQTALFVDAGNLWTKPELVDPTALRYSVGSGLRIGTPIGPLAFDYGFNVDRVLDEFVPDRGSKRFWEDIGAFHFSIGLF
ncbi:MAG: POTRA domain-containing protein [Polyangiaceae bacterium]